MGWQHIARPRQGAGGAGGILLMLDGCSELLLPLAACRRRRRCCCCSSCFAMLGLLCLVAAVAMTTVDIAVAFPVAPCVFGCRFHWHRGRSYPGMRAHCSPRMLAASWAASSFLHSQGGRSFEALQGEGCCLCAQDL